MKISYNWLQKYFASKLPDPKDLATLINSHSFEVEAIEEIDGDTVFDIKVMPDRAHYALCHKGIAREVKALAGLEMKPPTKAAFVETPNLPAVSVIIKEPRLCFRYMARRIENVVIASSPKDLQVSLTAIGARSISNVVDATNYVMMDVGQPLHAFDADKIKGSIVVRLAFAGEKIELLPEVVTVNGETTTKQRVAELTETDLVIADDLGPLAIAGIKGGRRAEISAETKNIIIEAANFDPVSIRRTAARLNLRNESSRRFENKIIPELAGPAIEAATALIFSLIPQAKVGPVTDVFGTKTQSWSITVEAKFIVQKSGIYLKEDEIRNIFTLLDCDIVGRDGETLVTPPLDRLDLTTHEDFVDEVARIKGYENLSGEMPPDLTKNAVIDKSYFWSEKIKDILFDKGFSEVMLYSLCENGSYEIAYPLASDKKALRESIVPKMQNALTMNSRNADLLGLKTIRLFEIGKVFPKEGEKTVITIGITLVRKNKGEKSEKILDDVISQILSSLHISLEGKRVVSGDTAIFEADIDKIIAGLPPATNVSDLRPSTVPRDAKFQPYSIFPFIVRDVAVFVPQNLQAEQVFAKILSSVGNNSSLLVRSELFDVFKKDEKISYAYRLVFQAKDRTLTDEEVNKIMDEIYGNLKKEEWEIR